MRWRNIFLLGVLTPLLSLAACRSGGSALASSESRVELRVDLRTKFQTMEGWRMSARLPPKHVKEETVRRILDDFAFDFGLTGLRLPVHRLQQVEDENDNDDPFHIRPEGFAFSRSYLSSDGINTIDPLRLYGAIVVPLKQRVEKAGNAFSVWVTWNYKFANFPRHWHDPEEYAELAEAYTGWLRSEFGFYPTYWAIVNEPDRPFFTSGEFEKDIIAVARRFRMRGIPTRIQSPETVRPDAAAVRQITSNPEVLPHLGLLSFHGYDYQSGRMPSMRARNEIRRIARRYGIRTAMTEVCCKRGWNGGYQQALGYARDIYWNLTEADVSIWEPLGLFAPGQVSWDADGNGYRHKAPYYAQRQYSRYIRPGHVRVDVQCTGCRSDDRIGQNIKPVAFRSPQGKLVLVIVNDQSVPQALRLRVPEGTYEVTGVEPAVPRGRTYPELQAEKGTPAEIVLPPGAIVTLAQR